MRGNITSAEVSADDPEDLDELYAGLRGATGIQVEAVAAPAKPGEQGAALDVLMVSLSSGAVTVFLQIIETLAKSHGPKFSLKISKGKSKIAINSNNLDEVLPVLKEIIDES